MKSYATIFVILLLTLSQSIALPEPLPTLTPSPDQPTLHPGDFNLEIFPLANCGGAVHNLYNVAQFYNGLVSIGTGCKSFTVSRGLNPGEQLDFVSANGRDWVASYALFGTARPKDENGVLNHKWNWAQGDILDTSICYDVDAGSVRLLKYGT